MTILYFPILSFFNFRSSRFLSLTSYLREFVILLSFPAINQSQPTIAYKICENIYLAPILILNGARMNVKQGIATLLVFGQLV